MRWLIGFLIAISLSAAERTPVLVELFTSEGCSSCPPADALLMKLNDSQPVGGVDVIGLEEHVDYWDGPSWRDPFSSAELTARQKQYVQRLGVESAYTPEMVIDGRSELVGSDSSKALKELAKERRRNKAVVHVTLQERSGDRVKLAVQVDGPGAEGDVLLVIAESGLASNVTGGENAGRNMRHSAVVRKLVAIGKVKKGEPLSTDAEFEVAREWKAENLSAVVFVQGTAGVQGVAELSLAP